MTDLFRLDVRRENPDEALRLAVLASGSGTNLEAILKACEEGSIHARVVVVISDNPGAYALERAKQYGISAVAVDRGKYADRRSHEDAVLKEAAPFKPQLAVLAGYMRLVTPFFLDAFTNPETGLPGVINIHPADTRAYQGVRGYEFALGLAGKDRKRLQKTWITVHFVDHGMDTGPIIAQEPLEVLPDDNLESLKERGLAVEHSLYPRVIDMISRGRVRMKSAGSDDVVVE